ncbi:hypothetical protein KU75_13705 [Pectobacterium odoriferum]|uniref:Uncharacterized protein n=1 Tax=Pectobacterium odoriferum TaxID=78398 RepID=A0ABR4VNR7_9GAMM|nr:hypothetical protein KU75_13705 [Pectobacterium odoriferum]
MHQQQQLIDETSSTAIAADNPCKQRLLIIAAYIGLQSLNIDSHRSQGGTQLMSGIGNENPFPFSTFSHPGKKYMNSVHHLAKLPVLWYFF